MNNFEENNEFVKRKISPDGQAPQSQRPLGEVRRPAPQASQRPNAPYRGANMPPRPPMQSTPARQMPPQTRSMPKPPPQAPKTAPKIPTPPKQKKEKEPIEAGYIIKNILIFIGMLAALLILGFALILSTLYVAPEKESTAYSYYYGINDKTPSDEVKVNRVVYINMTELSELCSFTVSGTKASLRFTADAGEYAEFTIGSVSAKVNGDIINMEGAALIRENESVWVPLSFGESFIVGMTFDKNEDEGKIRILRNKIPESSDEAPEYEPVTFRIKGSQAIESVGEDPYIGEMVDLGFVNDLSEYEQYMNPEDRDAYLILVNKTNTITSDYAPENLVSITNVRKDGRKEQMVECAEKALQALYIELKSAGYTDVSVTSGYRSYNKQVSLFTTYLQNEMKRDPSLTEAEAKEIVLTYSAFPGTSEHHTGLCCDMHNLGSADVAFANKEAYLWLKENCHKFGFVIRYPEDKVDITGYSFEPWHYRFVGRYHATRMNQLGMCLEEYVEHLNRSESN
ncbi:MAG: D-alanyl-D-alanine carboxypeptidase family protein [Clostridia bacterium]|nr:D-alanyl-D-alanine carboxypeptidase family protein [Clostridia bacterium]